MKYFHFSLLAYFFVYKCMLNVSFIYRDSNIEIKIGIVQNYISYCLFVKNFFPFSR